MLITIKDAPANLNGQFSGMVYPKGLAKNSTCLTEYRDQEGPLRYKLPLKSCNTMPIETVSYLPSYVQSHSGPDLRESKEGKCSVLPDQKSFRGRKTKMCFQ